jgi:L-aminopeptidase/D-esterase-like protein
MATRWEAGPRDAITDVRGIRVGHWTDRRAGTGCTVILCPTSTGAAVDARGGAPGSRETDVLASANVVRRCDAVVFSGGSAFGLAAADGVMRWCAEHGIGFTMPAGPVPIVSAAVIYDRGLGRAAAPGADEGYRAARRATGGRVAEGSVGAGTGATVAKLLGPEHMLKGGLGTASVLGPRGLVVGALAVTNPVGQIQDPETGRVIAGARGRAGRFLPLPEAIARRTEKMDTMMENTTLVCVATNAALDHHELQRLAIHAHDGLARTINPVHTFADGDIAFAIGLGQVEVKRHDVFTLGAMTVRAVERAVLKSVLAATSLHGVPSVSEWRGG